MKQEEEWFDEAIVCAFPNDFHYPISMRKVDDEVVIWEKKTMAFLIWTRIWDGETRFSIDVGENSIGELIEVIFILVSFAVKIIISNDNVSSKAVVLIMGSPFGTRPVGYTCFSGYASIILIS